MLVRDVLLIVFRLGKIGKDSENRRAYASLEPGRPETTADCQEEVIGGVHKVWSGPDASDRETQTREAN